MQFSLRMIFAVIAVVAVLAAEAVVFPEWIADIVGLAVTLLLPCPFVIQGVNIRGAGRAFGIGALCVWLVGTLWLFIFELLHNFDVVPEILARGGIRFCVFWLLVGAGGGVAVLVRWFSLAD